MTLLPVKYLLAAAAATTVAVAAAFDREGLIVPYAEDHFPDMASMRYDRSPFYRAIERATDTATIVIPAEWAGSRIVVGVGYPSDTVRIPSLRINGADPGPGVRPLRWDVSETVRRSGNRLHISGLGPRPRRVYAYATPRRVYVDSYHITSSLDTADMTKGVFEVDIQLGGIHRHDPSVAVEYMLFDRRRHQVAAGRADASPRIRFRARIPDIHPWSTDDPYRYMLAIILRDDNTGQHLMTVGSPMRFGNYTVPGGIGPVLNSVGMAPLALAKLDSIPLSPESRGVLADNLRAAGANAVINPDGVDPDVDWRNILADRGILCYADGALDPMTLLAANPADAERPQLPGGFDHMAQRYIRVFTELADTSTLTIAASTRSPFTRLGDFALDYEFITPSGRKLTSSSGVVTDGDPRTPVEITLYPPLPGQKGNTAALLPDDIPEAYLNLSWTPLRPMPGAEPGKVTGSTQFVIGAPPHLAAQQPQKLKAKKGVWRARHTELRLDPATGLPSSLRIEGRELLAGPATLTIDGRPVKAVATDISYDGGRRTLVARIDLDNPVSNLPVGHAVVGYTIGADGTLDIAVADATEGASMAFAAPADRVYLGRGPGDSPSGSANRIALYHARRQGRDTASQAHADTRHLTLLRPAGSAMPALHLAFDTPSDVTLTPDAASVALPGLHMRLSPR